MRTRDPKSVIRLTIAVPVLALLAGMLSSCEVDSGFGFFDSAAVNPDASVTVTGWATTFLGATMDVTVVADGEHHRLGPAVLSRPDVAAAHPRQGGEHGFSTTLRLPAGRHRLCAYATGVEGTISLLANCHVVTVPETSPDPPVSDPATCATKGDPQNPVRMVIENSTGHDPDEVYVTLTGKDAGAPYPPWDADPRNLIDNSVPLSCLPKVASDPSGNTRYFDLGEGIGAGLLWVSIGQPIPSGTGGLPAVQPSTDTAGYVFANVEFAYPGQGDVTNVDQFSMPIDLTVTDGSTVARTEYSAGTCEIVDGVHAAVAAYNDTFITPNGPLGTDYEADWDQIVVKNSEDRIIRILSAKARAQQSSTSPGGAANPYAPGWPDLTPYLETLKGEPLVFEGLFSPAAGTPHHDETGWYRYTGTMNSSGTLSLSGTIRATTTPGGGGATEGSVLSIELDGTDTNADGDVVGENDLATGVYFQNSRYAVDGVARNGLTNGVPEPAAPNDVYNTIYRDIVTALSYGYPGDTYGYDNTSFWNRWAPPEAPSGGKAAFAAAHPGETDYLGYNLWSATMYTWSDNYNIPYGENYGSGAPDRESPLLDVPAGGEWRMTLGKPVSDCADPGS